MLDQQQIRKLLPHGGAMCLIDSVQRWDRQSIECQTSSHRCADNPLRHRNQLPSHAAIEYGAQAAGIHGSLADHGGAGRRGYLAVLSSIEWKLATLDSCPAPLRIFAERQVTGVIGTMYRFRICTAQSDATLIQGQIVIAFDNAPA